MTDDGSIKKAVREAARESVVESFGYCVAKWCKTTEKVVLGNNLCVTCWNTRCTDYKKRRNL